MDAIGLIATIIQAINGAIIKYREIQSLQQESESFCHVLTSLKRVLLDVQQQLETDTPEYTSLQEPIRILQQAVQNGSQVLEECCSKQNRLKTRLFSKKYLSTLTAASSNIQYALTLLSASGVVVQGNILKGVQEVNQQVESLELMTQNHHEAVIDLLKEQKEEMHALPDQIILRMVEMGLVSDRQDYSDQIADIVKASKKLKLEKYAADEQILEMVVQLSLKEAGTFVSGSITQDLKCPISLETMKDPVTLVPSGHTYDKEQVCQSLLYDPFLDPLTRIRYDQPLTYVENVLARKLLMARFGDQAYIPYDDSEFRRLYDKKKAGMDQKDPDIAVDPDPFGPILNDEGEGHSRSQLFSTSKTRRRFNRMRWFAILLLVTLAVVATVVAVLMTGGGGNDTGEDQASQQPSAVQESESINEMNTFSPTSIPTNGPISVNPSTEPSFSPLSSLNPTFAPSACPSLSPSFSPTISASPTVVPSSSLRPSISPTASLQPSFVPTLSFQPTSSLVPTIVPTGSLVWTKRSEFIEGDTLEDSFAFVLDMSVDGSIVAVSSFKHDGSGSKLGRVQVFEWNETHWNQMGQDLIGDAEEGQFGRSLSLSGTGTILAVGAPHSEGVNCTITCWEVGHVKVFQWDPGFSRWNQVGPDIHPECPECTHFVGKSVSLSDDGTALVVAANINDKDRFSHVVWNGTGWEWNDGPTGNTFYYGVDNPYNLHVALAGDAKVVAAASPFLNTGNGTQSGLVRMYRQVPESPGDWISMGGELWGSEDFEHFGSSVAVSQNGTVVAIGGLFQSSGLVRVFVWDETAAQWTPMGPTFKGDLLDDAFGTSVALSDDGMILAVGAPGTLGLGYAETYEWNGFANEWDELGGRVQGIPNAAQFGTDVALSGDGKILSVGEPFSTNGQVHTFELLR